MIEAEFIARFCEVINQGLTKGEDWTSKAQQDLGGYTQYSSLLAHLCETFDMALRPQKFGLYHVDEVNADFHQSYELLDTTFDRSVLSPKVDYKSGMAARKNRPTPLPPLFLTRYWEVLGLHTYDNGGQLKVFRYDGLASTRQIAGVVGASYMSINGHEGLGSVGIGHLATIEHHRRKGHGRALVAELEKRMREYGASRGEKLSVMLLESEQRASPFWFSLGFGWPRGADYYQPPMEFDPATGKPTVPPVPEMLMVKVIDGDGDGTQIDRSLLLDTIRTLYKRWYIPDTESDAAAKEASDYLFGTLFAQFEASLPATGATIPLDPPPN